MADEVARNGALQRKNFGQRFSWAPLAFSVSALPAPPGHFCLRLVFQFQREKVFGVGMLSAAIKPVLKIRRLAQTFSQR